MNIIVLIKFCLAGSLLASSVILIFYSNFQNLFTSQFKTQLSYKIKFLTTQKVISIADFPKIFPIPVPLVVENKSVVVRTVEEEVVVVEDLEVIENVEVVG
jgi:hypothetical protein